MLQKKINALMSLLDDPDKIVYEAVRVALLKEGEIILPTLRHVIETTSSELKRRRAMDLLRIVGLKSVSCSLAEWIDDGADSLLYGAFLIARYIYPDLEYATINEAINEMWRSVRREVKSAQTPLERVRIINRYVFEDMGFSKNLMHPSSPSNNCINEVLSRSTGNHVTLSIIYAELCMRIGLPVRCVSLPKILILCYLDDMVMDEDGVLRTDDVMFYINPASKGTIVGREDIRAFLELHKVEVQDAYYLPCDNVEVVRRLLINMHYGFSVDNKNLNAEEVKMLIKTLDERKRIVSN